MSCTVEFVSHGTTKSTTPTAFAAAFRLSSSVARGKPRRMANLVRESPNQHYRPVQNERIGCTPAGHLLEPSSFLDHLADAQTTERLALAKQLHGFNSGLDIGLGFHRGSGDKPGDWFAVLGDGELFSLCNSL